ncbi:MAG: hypothetical protein ACJAZ0_000368 [Halioglobus sp.]|jgi:uncharacterized protein YaiL (DUF2058 family)
MASLQEQLLSAGVVDAKKAKNIQKEQRKKAKQHKGKALIDENKELAKQAQLEKVQKDREQNKQLQAQSNIKAIHAQVVQLITLNTIDRSSGETAYHFTDNKIVKKLYINAMLQSQLSNGQLGIAKLKDDYALVPRKIAEKIQEREHDAIVLLNSTQKAEIDAEDPYADYQIPDDLMW